MCRLEFGDEVQKTRHRIIEEFFVSRTKVAFSAEIISTEWNAVLHTTAATDCQMATQKALIGEVLFQSAEGPFLGTYREFFDWGFGYAAQSPFRRNKKITTESVAGMFDDNVVTAPCAKCAYCVMSAKTVLQNRIEESNAQFFRPIFVPAVEQPAKEVSVLLGRYRVIFHFTASGVDLDTGDELQIHNLVFDKEIEQFIGMFDVFII